MVIDDDRLENLRLDDGPGPATILDDEAARRMVRVAMDGPTTARVHFLRSPQARRAVLLVAAATLVTAAALARMYATNRPTSPAVVLTPPSPAAAPAPAPVASVPPTVSPEAPATVIPSRQVAASASRRVDDTSGLLERANQLRGQRRWREAEAAYAHVVEVAPESSESQAARIAAAQLRLEHLADPQGAETLFREADRRGGNLTQEAAWGIVEARRARGAVDQEKAAIEDYLRRFPTGAMVPGARARLTELPSSTP